MTMLRHPGIKSGRSDPSADVVLEALSKIRAGTVFGRELQEWAVWYVKNKRRVPEENLRLRCDFQEKAIDGLFNLVALLAREVKPQINRSDALWLPGGVSVDGDPRRFG